MATVNNEKERAEFLLLAETLKDFSRWFEFQAQRFSVDVAFRKIAALKEEINATSIELGLFKFKEGK